MIHELREGVRALAGNPPVRLVVALFGAQAFVRGALGVLLVVLAIDVLGIGDSGVGVLTAAFGVGGIVGALAGISLVGRGRLGRPFGLSLAGWGLPLVVVGLWPESAIAVICLALAGLANSLLDVSGFTSMQERIDEAVIGRIFGLFELVVIASVGLGALVAPLAIEVLGSRGALIAAGGLLAGLATLAYRPLGRMDEGAEVRTAELELLGRTTIFGPLPYATLRRLASGLGEHHAAAGETIVRQGDDGDIVYVIEQGRVAIDQDGRADPRAGAERRVRGARADPRRAPHGHGDGDRARRPPDAGARAIPCGGDGEPAEPGRAPQPRRCEDASRARGRGGPMRTCSVKTLQQIA